MNDYDNWILHWVTQIDERCSRATPGPWRPGTSNVWHDDHPMMPVASTERHTYEAGKYVPLHHSDDSLEREQADAEFIAAARTDIPRLIAIIREKITQLEYERNRVTSRGRRRER